MRVFVKTLGPSTKKVAGEDELVLDHRSLLPVQNADLVNCLSFYGLVATSVK